MLHFAWCTSVSEVVCSHTDIIMEPCLHHLNKVNIKSGRNSRLQALYTGMVPGCHFKYLVLRTFYPLCLTPKKTLFLFLSNKVLFFIKLYALKYTFRTHNTVRSYHKLIQNVKSLNRSVHHSGMRSLIMLN